MDATQKKQLYFDVTKHIFLHSKFLKTKVSKPRVTFKNSKVIKKYFWS
jgi:hypothetical protein